MLSFQVENNESLLPELQILLPAHCAEAVPSIMSAETIDFDMYKALLNADALHIVTARNKNGELCGYALYFLAPDAHNMGELTATSDAFYMKTENRGWESYTLMRHAEKTLQERGVSYVVNTVPYAMQAEHFMKRLGYKAISTQYMKKLGG